MSLNKNVITGVKNLVRNIIKMTMILSLSVFAMSCGKDSTENASGDVRVISAEIKNLKLDFQPLQERYEWKPEYTLSMISDMDRPELNTLFDTTINAYDLSLIHCSGLNQASVFEKKLFWVTFIASIAHAESTLNPNLTYHDVDGTLSSGLLQIDVQSANRHTYAYTGKSFTQNDLFKPSMNLMAGLYIMKHQLEGGMSNDRPEIARRLFTDRSYYWSVLAYKRDLIIRTFYKNARRNLGFCFI